MSFINREERDTHGLERREKPAAAKAFRRHIDQFIRATSEAVDARPLLALGERTVDESCRELAGLERIYLVLHQRDQWRDDQGRAAQDHRGELVAERLAAARGHNDHGVF